MYVAVLIACAASTCYRMGLYSQQEFPTMERCLNAFSYLTVNLPPTHVMELRVRCMLRKDFERLKPYPNGTLMP